ncbi:MAG: hypothetical protein WCF92_00345 [bacterium]
MQLSKNEIIGTGIFMVLCLIALTFANFNLSARNTANRAQIKDLQECNGLYNVQMAEMKLEVFLGGKEQNFETCRQIVFHLEAAKKNKADQLRIGQVATKLDKFTSTYSQTNRTAKQISEDVELFPKIVRLEHIIY